jgi:4-hydroxy-4-methyl-2-oxoglutarate aldolase
VRRHQLHGAIVSEIVRVDPNTVEGFRRHDAAKVADVMRGTGVMHTSIKPLARGMRVAGPAVTVLTRPGDVLFVLKASDVMRPGDVLVIDAGGNTEVAVMGDRYATYLKHIGTAGIVADGGCRDTGAIVSLGLPVWARGHCIAVFGSVGPGAINVPVQCGGAVVNPGDLILGDDDGVVVVPRDDARRVLALADEHLEEELAWVRQIAGGRRWSEIHNLGDRVKAWQE